MKIKFNLDNDLLPPKIKTVWQNKVCWIFFDDGKKFYP